MEGLSGKPHVEMDDDWGHPHFRKTKTTVHSAVSLRPRFTATGAPGAPATPSSGTACESPGRETTDEAILEAMSSALLAPGEFSLSSGGRCQYWATET